MQPGTISVLPLSKCRYPEIRRPNEPDVPGCGSAPLPRIPRRRIPNPHSTPIPDRGAGDRRLKARQTRPNRGIHRQSTRRARTRTRSCFGPSSGGRPGTSERTGHPLFGGRTPSGPNGAGHRARRPQRHGPTATAKQHPPAGSGCGLDERARGIVYMRPTAPGDRLKYSAIHSFRPRCCSWVCRGHCRGAGTCGQHQRPTRPCALTDGIGPCRCG